MALRKSPGKCTGDSRSLSFTLIGAGQVFVFSQRRINVTGGIGWFSICYVVRAVISVWRVICYRVMSECVKYLSMLSGESSCVWVGVQAQIQMKAYSIYYISKYIHSHRVSIKDLWEGRARLVMTLHQLKPPLNSETEVTLANFFVPEALGDRNADVLNKMLGAAMSVVNSHG